jgi:hypothetical protein
VREPEGKRPLERSRSRCLNNTKINYKELGGTGVERIIPSQDRKTGDSGRGRGGGSSQHDREYWYCVRAANVLTSRRIIRPRRALCHVAEADFTHRLLKSSFE